MAKLQTTGKEKPKEKPVKGPEWDRRYRLTIELPPKIVYEATAEGFYGGYKPEAWPHLEGVASVLDLTCGVTFDRPVSIYDVAALIEEWSLLDEEQRGQISVTLEEVDNG